MLFLTNEPKDFALIETILWDRKLKPEKGCYFFLLNKHLQRMEKSAKFFNFNFQKEILLKNIIKLNDIFLKNQRALCIKTRILLFQNGKFKVDYSYLNSLSSDKIIIDISKKHVNSKDVFLYHKTTKRELFNNERKRIEKQGIFETIFLNEKNQLTQGTITNLFLDFGEKELLTPEISCGLLPGTLRQHLIEQKKAKEALLYPEDLKKAKKIYIGNSVRGLLKAKLKIK